MIQHLVSNNIISIIYLNIGFNSASTPSLDTDKCQKACWRYSDGQRDVSPLPNK